jgi:CRISPR-associated endonuclease/helicase Cas3
MKQVADHSYIARIKEDGTPQYLTDHAQGTSALAATFTGKIGLPEFGELMGLLHDVGKYSEAFQSYIRSAEGMIEPDDDGYIEPRPMKGKIDHSTAGAQHIWENRERSPLRQIAMQIMALCVASHHSGLMDCLSPDGNDKFSTRLAKPATQTHADEVRTKVEASIRDRVSELLTSTAIEDRLGERLELLFRREQSLEMRQFMLGFLARFLFSGLIDADRLNSAGREPDCKQEWSSLIERLEAHLGGFTAASRIDQIRADVAASCLTSALRERGLYQLTVPTGGGKTLGSLRFALHHAAKHSMDRIIYVVPYTSIIDQNARVTREVFKSLEEAGTQIVLEHHSNLTPELETSQSKLLSENWDAPIIYTTAVQFLETLFAAGTRGVRRLHQLGNAVIIFDEVQTLPIRTVHLFNSAINFLVGQCGSTVVFCTATQPLLNEVDRERGAARLSPDSQMMPDVGSLFKGLHRATIEDGCKRGGWTDAEIAETALWRLGEASSVLIIVNKKAQARQLYRCLYGRTKHVYHLSTSMCPAHRMAVLDRIKACLDPDNPVPIICVSTQLIEAGVDVDFGSVIRYLAGLDSIAQAAGRCNRHDLRPSGKVLIVNPANENLDNLPDIRMAKEVAERVLHEFHTDPSALGDDLQGPATMSRYYLYYFFRRAHEMAYPVSSSEIGRDDDLLSLLAANPLSVQAYQRVRGAPPALHLRQSFMTAGKAFKAIDAPTEGVVVPYGEEGKRLIDDLMASSPFEDRGSLVRRAQRYAVNLFPHEIDRLKRAGRLYEIWGGSGVLYLDEQHYSDQFGASTEKVADMKVLITRGGDHEEPH